MMGLSVENCFPFFTCYYFFRPIHIPTQQPQNSSIKNYTYHFTQKLYFFTEFIFDSIELLNLFFCTIQLALQI